MHPSLSCTEHRPWPLPETPWTWRQSWKQLAFIHYRVDATRLTALLPSSLRLQTFDGSAWVGLVPFQMEKVMRRGLPAFPPFSSFPELNLRTYVEAEGKPGVWFFSLDASCWPVVWGGQQLYRLPYHHARMTHHAQEGWREFESMRREQAVHFKASYRGTGPVFYAEKGSFEHWATERYYLYGLAKQGLTRVEVHHAPWPLQQAEINIEHTNVLDAANIQVADPQSLCHYSPGVDVVSFPIAHLPQPK